VLHAGELHICFAALHALGKYVEESGIDSIAVEKGIYTPDIWGKSFKRGVDYHMANALACYISDSSNLQIVGTFLVMYTHQVACLLNIIRACRQGNWEEYLAALDKQIKYFFAHDMYNCARPMSLHLAQMNVLQTHSPETWKALKEGDVCAKNTGTPLTNLFVDQTLEQEIRGPKVVGGITGLTQNESTLKQFLRQPQN
jgi:hypothetical protein